MIRFYLLTFYFASVVTMLCAQDDKTLEYLRQQEQRKKAEILRELDSGVYLMEINQYEEADKKFRYVLSNVKSVPSDLTFYFGKNSFYLQHYKQAIDWINKYIQLKGTNGQFFEEALNIIAKAEKELVAVRTTETRAAADLFSENYDIDCGPSGKVSCPVCKGDHVIIKKTPLGDEYKTCPYCNEHGLLSCAEYNQLLRGELQKKH